MDSKDGKQHVARSEQIGLETGGNPSGTGATALSLPLQELLYVTHTATTFIRLVLTPGANRAQLRCPGVRGKRSGGECIHPFTPDSGVMHWLFWVRCPSQV